jgi:hypothetical protein
MSDFELLFVMLQKTNHDIEKSGNFIYDWDTSTKYEFINGELSTCYQI